MALTFRRRRRDPAATMSVVEHLGELRRRLIISIAAVAVGAAGGWLLYGRVFSLLSDPYCSFMQSHPQLANNPQNPCALFFTTVTEPLFIKLKVAAFIGLVLALPVVLYQVWRFVTPGLMPNERRYAVPFVLVSLFLFALGAVFAYLLLPRGLTFLLGFAGTTRVSTVISIGRYVSFVTLVILAFGVAFEFPVVLTSLALTRVITTRQLRRARGYALLLVGVFAAVITPTGDAFTMLALMVPLIIFYELSIVIARLFGR
jgi:sec-independent protein translocase protein TatC